MESKKYKEDNKTIKELTRLELSKKIVQIGIKHLTKLEAEVLSQTLIDNKSFAEIGESRQLTSGRVKRIFQTGILRLNIFLDNIDSRMETYLKIIENYSVMEKQIAEYEKIEDKNEKERNKFESLSPKTQDLLKTKITDTALSARIKNLCRYGDLYGYKIDTVADLTELNPKELRKFRNCGDKSIKEIEDFFSKNDLMWEMLD